VRRSVPFGMLRARHTYATRFAVVGGGGRTHVDCVAEDISSEVSVCKVPMHHYHTLIVLVFSRSH
jgi:hypothetical protein